MHSRRRFLVGTLMLASSVAARAQQVKSPRTIGVLAQDLQPGLLEAFRDELHKLGYVEGSGYRIELRNAAGRNELLPGLVEQLLRLGVNVIVAINTPAAQAAKKATRTVPIVMMRVADPVRSGLVPSLAHPGGNVTGLSFMPDALGPKGVELLREVLPQISRMAALYQGDNAGAVVIVDEVVRKGERLGLKFVRLPVKAPDDYASAFEVASRARAEGLFVMDDGAITKHRQQVLDLAAKQSLPVVSIYRDFAESGGLIAYGPSLDIVYRRAAAYVVMLLKGDHASDLPIEQPTKFDLVVNLKTAKALGVTIPQAVLLRADEVIQ
ncbi:MAG TPA: ABC transporter substrate-binding protein [Burkholderiaceae bacterium]|nr:ABC transporter substrate-binding protein [Burkholderiaceae bacterium]HSC00074.1 ABC transporter substrate-binding protein [Burkholderiaceae bacterium]